LSIPVPQELVTVQQYFAAREFRAERFGEYHLHSWQKYFGEDPDFCAFVDRHPGPIARGDFTVIGDDGCKTLADARQLFLASMIWGYGTVGYGAYRTRHMLSTPGADEQLQAAIQSVASGQLIEAYQALQLYKCGPSFMSKFLYAIGLRIGATSLPLILDSIVARSLQRLLASQGVDHRSFFTLDGNGMVCRDADGYARYVLLPNEWASTLGVLPDAVELCLFEMG
jgi:hypothetical protein